MASQLGNQLKEVWPFPSAPCKGATGCGTGAVNLQRDAACLIRQLPLRWMEGVLYNVHKASTKGTGCEALA